MKQRILIVMLAAAAAACTSAPSRQAAPARIEIAVVDTVGFTITEDARIDGDIRAEYDRAQALLGQGRLGDGIEVLESIVAKAPELSAPRVDLAIAYHRNGDLESAEGQLKQVLELNPNHPIALNELGIIYRKTARFADARRSYEAALAVYPGYHYARRNLAVLCDLYLSDLDCAEHNYEAYLATVHSDDEASMWLTDVRYRLGRTEN